MRWASRKSDDPATAAPSPGRPHHPRSYLRSIDTAAVGSEIPCAKIPCILLLLHYKCAHRSRGHRVERPAEVDGTSDWKPLDSPNRRGYLSTWWPGPGRPRFHTAIATGQLGHLQPWYLENTRVALVPPKPKLLVSAALTSRCCASFGTRLNFTLTPGSSRFKVGGTVFCGNVNTRAPKLFCTSGECLPRRRRERRPGTPARPPLPGGARMNPLCC